MAPIQDRSAPAAAAAPTFSLGAVVGVAVGGALLLGIVMVSVTLVILRSKHRRAIAKMEQENVSKRLESLENDHINTRHATIPSTKGFTFVPNSSSAWGALSSTEDLQSVPSPRRSLRFSPLRKPREQKESEKLSWPLPKHLKPPGYDVQMKKLKAAHLSSIVESPKDQSKTGKPKENMSEECLIPSKSVELVPSLAVQPLYPDENREFRKTLRTRSMGMERGQSLGTDQYKSVKRPASYNTNRSISVPSLLSQVPENSAISVDGQSRPPFRLRSVSLGQLPGAVPTAPLPSLPSNFALLQNRLSSLDLSPRSSVSSESSTSSAILKIGVSPSMHAVRDFSKRHPEMGLGGKIRDGISDELKRTLLGDRKGSPDQATIMSQKYLPSHQGSLCDLTARSSTYTVLGKHLADSSAADDFEALETTARLSVASGIKVKRISSSNNINDNPIRVVDSSRRTSQIQSVSRDGSPLERKRSMPNLIPDGKSLLAQPLPSPPTSAGSVNMFDWRLPSPVQPDGSGSKRPPSQRRSHKRSSLTRSLVLPNSNGSPNPGNSLLTLTEGSGETSETPSAATKPASTASLQRPPSTDRFSPAVRLQYPSALVTSVPQSTSETTSTKDFGVPIDKAPNTDSEDSPSTTGFSIPRFPSPGRLNQVSTKSNLLKSNIAPENTSTEAKPLGPVPGNAFRATDYANSPESSPHVSFLPGIVSERLSFPEIEPTTSTSPPTEHASELPRTSHAPVAHPFDKAPNFQPPRSTDIPHFSRPSPNAARNASQIDLMKSIKALRRMNSDFLDISQEDRQYLKMGREPDLEANSSVLKHSKSNSKSSMFLSKEFGGKENLDSQRFSMLWDNDSGGTALQILSENRRSMTPSPTSSRYSSVYGGKRVSFKRNTTGSLYDLDGFLIAER